MIIVWYYVFVSFIFNPTYSQNIYRSSYVFSSPGTQYLPANEQAQFISSAFVNSRKLCAMECNKNVLCRIFDYGVLRSNECRLFEGDVGTLGSIVSSSVSDTVVGTLQMSSSLFSQYGQSCSSICVENRYLICNASSVCDCMPHSYWNASTGMCLPQITIEGIPCERQLVMCREDIGLMCTGANQCGSK